MKRCLVIVAALTMFGVNGAQSLVSSQPTIMGAAMPPLTTLSAKRTPIDAAPAWRVDMRDVEQGREFHVHDRHWSRLFPRGAVPPFGSDPLQRRHWWADPLLRRHWWE